MQSWLKPPKEGLTKQGFIRVARSALTVEKGGKNMAGRMQPGRARPSHTEKEARDEVLDERESCSRATTLAEAHTTSPLLHPKGE